MSQTILSIALFVSPLLLLALAALFTEYAGCLAIFLEGFINFASFTCFLFANATQSIALALVLTVLLCFFMGLFFAFVTLRTNANAFLVGASINLLLQGLITVLSSIFFGTAGVLSLPVDVPFALVNGASIVIAFIIWFYATYTLHCTKRGLLLRITGTNALLVSARGFSVTNIKMISWAIASSLAAVAGCMLCMRMAAFVPQSSSGKGWIALAIVFLGRKNCIGVFIATVAFATAEHIANSLQSIQIIPPMVLFAVPSLVALLLFALIPSSQDEKDL